VHNTISYTVAILNWQITMDWFNLDAHVGKQQFECVNLPMSFFSPSTLKKSKSSEAAHEELTRDTVFVLDSAHVPRVRYY
jgi:hypothetical protein